MNIHCRCCLTSNDGIYYSLLSVFPDVGEEEASLVDVLKMVTCHEVPISKNFPSEICEDCVQNLKVASNFIELFKSTQNILRDTLKNYQSSFESKEVDKVSQESVEPPVLVEADENQVILLNYEELKEENFSDEDCKRYDDEFCSDFKETDHTFREAKEYLNDIDNVSDYHESSKNFKDLESSKDEDFENDDNEFINFLLERQKSRKEINQKDSSDVIVMTVEDVLKIKKRNKYRKLKKKCEDEINIFKCESCDKMFETKRNLMQHKYRMHNPNWKERFKCAECNKQFETGPKLRHHMEKHKIRTETYLCSLCGKTCKSSTALRYHLRLHNDQRNFMCRYCGFKTMALHAMKRHERTHSGERPFTCRYCEKSFAGLSERQKHEWIHQGITPYKCQYCEKRFTQAYNMQVHMMQHDGNNKCRLCKKSFVDFDVLKFHFRKVHKITIKKKDENDLVESK